jgi:hypothetical protein
MILNSSNSTVECLEKSKSACTSIHINDSTYPQRKGHKQSFKFLNYLKVHSIAVLNILGIDQLNPT